MKKDMKILRNKLNQLEVDTLRSAQFEDTIVEDSVSENKQYFKKFYNTLEYLHRNYPKAYKRVYKKFHSKQIDITFYIVRFIINEFRLLLHVPMSKEDASIEVIKDLNFDDNDIIDAKNDYNHNDKLGQEFGDNDLKYTINDIIPMINELQRLINSKNNWFNITSLNYSFDDEDDVDYSIHFKSIPNDADIPKYSKEFNKFRTELNQLNTYKYKASSTGIPNINKSLKLYGKLNSLFNILTDSKGDMFWAPWAIYTNNKGHMYWKPW